MCHETNFEQRRYIHESYYRLYTTISQSKFVRFIASYNQE